MTKPARQLRQYCFGALLLFVSATLALTSYTLWRLRAEAILNGIETSAMHSRSFEDFITQSLHVTDLIGANILGQEARLTDAEGMSRYFNRTLRHAPFIRSMSLLSDDGKVIASSNSANINIDVVLDEYLPPTPNALDVLRIGTPWTGRDFADGQPGSGKDIEPRFTPIARALKLDGQALTLLIALNPDYFVNHMTQSINAGEGTVEIIRYDGILLMSTDPDEHPGALREFVTRELNLTEGEIGEFEQKLDTGLNVLTSFRASRLYPFVVVTQLRRDYALSHWWSETKTLFAIVSSTLLAIVFLVVVFYRRQLQLMVQRAENEHLQRINATVFDASTEATLIADPNATIVSINPAFTRITGFHSEEIVGLPLQEFIAPDDKATFSAAVSGQPGLMHPSGPVPIEVRQRCKDGSLIWTEILATADRNEQGVVTGYYRICRNITVRKQMEDQVRQLAFHDQLTNLPNRRLLNNYLDLAMAANKRSGQYGALMFMDLDNFKPLNDCYGHEVGDLLLIEAAIRLKACIRGTDMVVRFGGDEFVVLVSGLAADREEATGQAALIAEKVRIALAEPYVLTMDHEDDGESGTIKHQCTSSIGVALFIHHEQQDSIIKWADNAMYEAKEAGGNSIRFHTSKD